ncbi:GTPase [Pararhodobacter sp. SW119]|uniref:YcjF family protein n=1 Tax=Pararhodobacter sp. SW119 TaxID=2780075 RepID=UPI001ADF09B7
MKGIIRKLLGEGERLGPAETPDVPVPTLWLLGKTGAGKSSVVRALTGVGEVGSGFTPCTRTAHAFDYPAETPVLRFLDTRGLGEAGYDPSEDLAEAERGSHMVLVIARLDDPVQGSIAQALAAVRARRPEMPVLMVHTGADLPDDPGALQRARSRTQSVMEKAAGDPLPAVTLALPEAGAAEGLEDLRGAIAELLPELTLLMMREKRRDAEARRFAELRPIVMWYASAAAASDAAPLVGVVSVPALQGAMLHALARRQGVDWTAARAGLFASALGSGILLRYAAGFALRQGAKLVPFVGQTLGAAAAATVSFAATYALGRVAAAWLFRTSRGETVDAADLRKLYVEALRSARDAPR